MSTYAFRLVGGKGHPNSASFLGTVYTPEKFTDLSLQPLHLAMHWPTQRQAYISFAKFCWNPTNNLKERNWELIKVDPHPEGYIISLASGET